MRVLIVDGFSNSRKGREAFADFEMAVKRGLEGPYYKFLTEVAFGVRKCDDLRDFCYDIDGVEKSGLYNDSNSLKAFQNLDMLFISGDDASIIPWGEKGKPLRMLLKQCITYSMPTFLAGYPIYFLVFLVHLKGENIRVFNGRGYGGSMTELEKMHPKVKRNISALDTFLDSETGDIWRKKEYGEFSQIGNVGIFHAQKKQAVDVYKTRGSWIKEQDPTRTRKDEVMVEISSQRYAQHWLLKDLPKRFIATHSVMWAMHSKISPRFQIYLVQRPNSLPQCISLDNTIFGCQFQITKLYPESMMLLMNWCTYICEALLKNPGKRVGGVGPDILNPVGVEAGLDSMWEERLIEEIQRRKKQQKKLLKEAEQDDEYELKVGGFPSRALTASRGAVETQATQATTHTEDFAKLFGEWPTADGQGDGGNATLKEQSDADYHIDTIMKALETTEINLATDTRTFSKLDIRKMLHPDADVSSITPYVPPKEVRVNNVRKPFTRWRYYEELEHLERGGMHPCMAAGGQGSRPGTRGSRPGTSGTGSTSGSRPGTRNSDMRNSGLSAYDTRPHSMGGNALPSNMGSGVSHFRQIQKPSASSVQNFEIYQSDSPRNRLRTPEDVLRSSHGQVDIDYFQQLTKKPMTAPGGPHFKRPRGLQRRAEQPEFNRHVGRATTSRGIGHVVDNYVSKTPGPLYTEHIFRNVESGTAVNRPGVNPEFLPIGLRTGGWTKSAVHGFPASHKALTENERHMLGQHGLG